MRAVTIEKQEDGSHALVVLTVEKGTVVDRKIDGTPSTLESAVGRFRLVAYDLFWPK